jgi:hypothetical protein
MGTHATTARLSKDWVNCPLRLAQNQLDNWRVAFHTSNRAETPNYHDQYNGAVFTLRTRANMS